jgi:hypothetical protein
MPAKKRQTPAFVFIPPPREPSGLADAIVHLLKRRDFEPPEAIEAALLTLDANLLAPEQWPRAVSTLCGDVDYRRCAYAQAHALRWLLDLGARPRLDDWRQAATVCCRSFALWQPLLCLLRWRNERSLDADLGSSEMEGRLAETVETALAKASGQIIQAEPLLDLLACQPAWPAHVVGEALENLAKNHGAAGIEDHEEGFERVARALLAAGAPQASLDRALTLTAHTFHRPRDWPQTVASNARQVSRLLRLGAAPERSGVALAALFERDAPEATLREVADAGGWGPALDNLALEHERDGLRARLDRLAALKAQCERGALLRAAGAPAAPSGPAADLADAEPGAKAPSRRL